MKHTPVYVHAGFGLCIAASFFSENWYAGVAWAVAWFAVLVSDIQRAKFAPALFAIKLFVDAHHGKWPSKEAESKAADALAEFMKKQ